MTKLQAGVFELPVMLEAPSTELTKASTEQAGSSTKHWVDNRKPIFTVELLPATTVHALDVYIDRFLSLTAKLQLGECMKVLNPMSDTLFKYRISTNSFPPLFNSFRCNYSIFEVKNCHNAEII